MASEEQHEPARQAPADPPQDVPAPADEDGANLQRLLHALSRLS